jgi:hypothetical protein
MRVIMLIEVKDEAALSTVHAHLQEGVEADRIDGFFTLCKDGKSLSHEMPAYMVSERNLCDWIAPFERIAIAGKPTWDLMRSMKPTAVIDGPDGERFNAMQD